MRIVFAVFLLLVVNSLAQETHYCPDGWDLHERGERECKCFLFARAGERVTHDDAKTLCMAHDAWLAEVDDGPGDNNWLVNQLLSRLPPGKKEAMPEEMGHNLGEPHFEDQWWIGARSYGHHDEHEPGKWVWEHLNKTVEWFDWAPGEPNDYHRQQCLSYLHFNYFGQPYYNWNDWDCKGVADYICEKLCDKSF